MKALLSGLYPALKDILFPPTCLRCNQKLGKTDDLLFCPDCTAQIPLIKPPFCTCCGQEFPNSTSDEHLCGICLRKPPYFQRARAIFRYNKFTAPLIHAFKYQGRTTAQKTFRTLWQKVSSNADLTHPDIIIPIPLHIKRLQERGFNQSLILARIFFPNDLQRIKPTLLIRQRRTKTQTGLDGRSRRQNLAGAFHVPDKSPIKDKKILLIDDVFTTGTTTNECAKVLLKNGAKQIEVLTLARVHHDESPSIDFL